MMNILRLALPLLLVFALSSAQGQGLLYKSVTPDGKTIYSDRPPTDSKVVKTITPQKGGVGPLTICALFDNVIRAARQIATANEA